MDDEIQAEPSRETPDESAAIRSGLPKTSDDGPNPFKLPADKPKEVDREIMVGCALMFGGGLIGFLIPTVLSSQQMFWAAVGGISAGIAGVCWHLFHRKR